MPGSPGLRGEPITGYRRLHAARAPHAPSAVRLVDGPNRAWRAGLDFSEHLISWSGSAGQQLDLDGLLVEHARAAVSGDAGVVLAADGLIGADRDDQPDPAAGAPGAAGDGDGTEQPGGFVVDAAILQKLGLEHPPEGTVSAIGALLRRPGHEPAVVLIGRRPDRDSFCEEDRSALALFVHNAGRAIAAHDRRMAAERERRLEEQDRIAATLRDTVIRDVFSLSLGLQGFLAAQQSEPDRYRLRQYIDSLDRIITDIRTAVYQIGNDRTDR